MREKPPLQVLDYCFTLPSTALNDSVIANKWNDKRKATNFTFAWSGTHYIEPGRKTRFQNRFFKA